MGSHRLRIHTSCLIAVWGIFMSSARSGEPEPAANALALKIRPILTGCVEVPQRR